ncbi:T9SS type A sorting domain-containing protein [Flavobacterium sp. 9AF]|uniref:T9SS type A sorting domain-containing protein n=1 Tax=Flavobacterium sp. 9AF TaxID=2653142 RepID=UPI00135CE734|nr:T9SS type A sorting domain-containing protein [Flavobacterium sp. 9AF]
MKKHYLLIINLFFFISLHSQNTYIPDNGFEQLLIDISIDLGPLDNYVPTANISGVEDLNILSNYNITDLTGLQDFTSIEALHIDNNPISTIDLSGNPILYDVSLTNMNLTSITIPNNSIIAFLDVSNNSITSLDLTGLSNLQYLNIENNQITDLDLSSKLNLNNLNVKSNNLISLNIKNGSNSLLTTFDATNNPNLACIQVDNQINANAGIGNYSSWLKDATSNYLEDCNTLHIDNTSLLNAQVYPNPIAINQILNFKNLETNFTFSIYDYSGKLIDKKNIKDNYYKIENIATGIYFYTIETNTNLFTNKLIVK